MNIPQRRSTRPPWPDWLNYWRKATNPPQVWPHPEDAARKTNVPVQPELKAKAKAMLIGTALAGQSLESQRGETRHDNALCSDRDRREGADLGPVVTHRARDDHPSLSGTADALQSARVGERRPGLCGESYEECASCLAALGRSDPMVTGLRVELGKGKSDMTSTGGEWKEKAALVPTCLEDLEKLSQSGPAADEASASDAHPQVRRRKFGWPQRMAGPYFNGTLSDAAGAIRDAATQCWLWHGQYLAKDSSK